MSIPLTINGVTYNYPVQFDKNWGPTLTNWSQAVTNGMLQKAGGSFTLTSEVDFGSNFGLKALYLKSRETNIASTGILRLANASSGIAFRNASNSADLVLTVNASNQLTFNGTSIGATTSLTNGHILVGNASNQPADVAMSGDTTIDNTGAVTIANSTITNAKVSSSAAIALSKLAALTVSRIVTTDGSGVLTTTASPTLTELGYLSGVGSAIQTQINGLLSKTGGTMSGIINMGNNKITALMQGTTTGDAIAYPVGTSQISAGAITTALLASHAVTQVLNSFTGPGRITSVYGGATSVSITTSGGTVLVVGVVGMAVTNSAPAGASYGVAVWRDSSVSVLADADGGVVVTANQILPQLTVMTIDTPAAGTYVYHLGYRLSSGGFSSLNNYSLTAVELKA